MADAFLVWLREDFGPNLLRKCKTSWRFIADMVGQAGYVMLRMEAWVILIAILIATLPLWGLPFLYWYFAVWKKREGEEEHDGSGSKSNL